MPVVTDWLALPSVSWELRKRRCCSADIVIYETANVLDGSYKVVVGETHSLSDISYRTAGVVM